MAYGDYYNPNNKTVNAGDIVYASDINDINAAVDAGFEQVAADITEVAAGSADVSKAWATNPQGDRPDILVADYSSKAYAREARDAAYNTDNIIHKADGTTVVGATGASAYGSAVSAQGFAANASNSASTATTQAGIATTKASEAAASALAADASADAAAISEFNADASADAAAASAAAFTAANLLTSIKTVDGAASGLDADLLDGQHGAFYAPIASPTLTGTPLAPTPAVSTNTTQLVTAAFAHNLINGGYQLSTTGGTVALTVDQICNTYIQVVGALTSDVTIEIPTDIGTAQRMWVFLNGTTGAFRVYFKQGAGAAIEVLQSRRKILFGSSNALYEAMTEISSAVNGVTQPLDTNTNQLATTQFVLNQAYDTNPVADGAATPGVSERYSRGDHRHPTDTTRAPLASPTLTGTPAAPTAVAGTSTTQLATTAFVTTADNLKANLASPALTGTPTAPTAALGTNTTQLATTAFVSGTVGGLVTGVKNKIINGAMLVDQRNSGAAQTVIAGAALAYTVDRFYAYCTGANVTGQQVDGPVANTKRYRFTGAASVTGVGFATRLEAVNTARMAGNTAALQVKLSSSSLTTITWTAFYANTADTFGTIASPTRTQIATGNFTINATEATYSASIAIPVAATTGIEIRFTGGALLGSQTLTVGDVQLELGTTASEFEDVGYAETINVCQRYYEKGFAQNYVAVAGVGQISTPIIFKATKRIIPTVTVPSVTPGAHSASFITITEFIANCIMPSAYVNTNWTATAEL